MQLENNGDMNFAFVQRVLPPTKALSLLISVMSADNTDQTQQQTLTGNTRMQTGFVTV